MSKRIIVEGPGEYTVYMSKHIIVDRLGEYTITPIPQHCFEEAMILPNKLEQAKCGGKFVGKIHEVSVTKVFLCIQELFFMLHKEFIETIKNAVQQLIFILEVSIKRG